jgi:hypothetical protein
MDIIRPFPARVPPLPGESLTSLIRRTTEAMGYESVARVVSLLAERGRLPRHLNQLLPGRVFDYLAALLCQPPETVSSLTVHHFAPSLVLVQKDQPPARVCDSQTILRYFSSSWLVCPACLGQDQVPYERLLWSFQPIPICVEHGCLLINRCPACQRPLRWDRPDVSRCRCSQRLGDVEPLAVSSQGIRLSQGLQQVLLGSVQAFTEMSAAACFWWGDRMAAAIRRTPTWLTKFGQCLGLQPQCHDDAIAWIAAAEILNDWPRRLEAFLDVFQQIDKHKTTSTGVGRRFGTLLRQAAKLEELGHPAPAVALRQYLVAHYAGGHLSGKVCLFQKAKERSALRQRAWVTQTLAAKMLGLRHGTVAKLMQEGILQGRLHPAGQHGRSIGLVLRKSVETLQAELHDPLDVQAAARRLGVDRHRVLDLIHSRIFPRAIRTAKGWLIPRASVVELKNFCERLPAGKPTSSRWLSVRQATRMFGPTGLTLALLVELIRVQRVSARMADLEKRLNGIVVSHTDLMALVSEIRDRRDQQHGYPVHHLGKVLFPNRPIKCSVIKKWIAARLLKARKSGRARLVAAEEVERFRLEYCPAEEACRSLGITRSTLSRWEVEGLVQPVYGKRVTPGAGFSLYRRADLAGLSRRRAA